MTNTSKTKAGPNRRQLLTGTAALAVAQFIPASYNSAIAAAPMLGTNTPLHYRIKLGDFEITNILDTIKIRKGPYPIIGAKVGETAVTKLMRDNLLPENKWQPGYSPTLINTGKELILFDTGNGDNADPNTGMLGDLLETAGYSRDQIDIVIITHGHGDHIRGLLKDGKPQFPNARYLIGEKEYNFWTTSNMNTDRMKKGAALFKKQTAPIKDKTTFYTAAKEIISGIHPIEAFGHTPGHMAFHIESNGQQLLLWADCAHHHVASLARPDWEVKFDVDKAAGAKTRKKIFDMTATDRIGVIGYHMPFPSIGYVEKRKAEEGYRWLAHSFQLK